MNRNSSSPPSVRHVTVEPDRDGQRLDNFLIAILGRVPRSLVYRLVRTGQVRVNGSRARPHMKLAAGDSVRIPPLREGGGQAVAIPETRIAEMRERVILERPELLAFDKPAGLAVHGGSNVPYGMAEIVARAYGGTVRPAHRLDRATSGVIVFGRGREALKRIQDEFRRRTLEKRYLALLTGELDEDAVEVDKPLEKIRDAAGQRRVIPSETGRVARTRFVVLRRFPGHTYVEARIETGRMHQIRAHARAIGHAVAGDDLYNPEPSPPGLKRLFLHAHALRLPWPEDLVLSAPLPRALTDCLETLGS